MIYYKLFLDGSFYFRNFFMKEAWRNAKEKYRKEKEQKGSSSIVIMLRVLLEPYCLCCFILWYH